MNTPSLPEILEILHNENAFLQSSYHVTELGVFGSSVKGTLRKNSDIDVLVSFSQGRKDLFNYMRLKMYLEELLGRKVDLVIRESVKPHLRDRILSEVRYTIRNNIPLFKEHC